MAAGKGKPPKGPNPLEPDPTKGTDNPGPSIDPWDRTTANPKPDFDPNGWEDAEEEEE